MSTLTIPQLTPDDRLWRIDWFGQVDYQPGRHSQPCIRVVTSPVQCDPNDQIAMLSATATDTQHQRQTWLPIGLLFLLRIGDIWQGGKCVLTPGYQTETFKSLSVVRETTSIIKAGLSLDGEFILPLFEHPWHRKQTQSYCLLVNLPNGKRIVIPCMELIRFYFGSSSKLLHLLFTRLISEDMFWKHKHFDNFSRRLHLKLADGLSGMSATDIGRMALDSNAWQAARLIFHSGLAASVQRESIFPYTVFPFIGQTDLVATGKWLPFGAVPDATFVLYNLQSCSHPFPFASLSYEVSESTKTGAKKQISTSQGLEGQKKTAAGKSSTPKSQVLTGTDPGKSLSIKEKYVEGRPRFPDLMKKPVWRERYDTNDPPAIFFINSELECEQVSVGEGISRNKKVRGIDVGAGYVRVQLAELDSQKYKFVFDGIEPLYSQPEIKIDTVTTELIILPGHTHPVISLPHLIDENGEINSLAFCKDQYGSQRPRRGCFVEMKISGETFYRAFILESGVHNGVSLTAISVETFDLMSVALDLQEDYKNLSELYQE